MLVIWIVASAAIAILGRIERSEPGCPTSAKGGETMASAIDAYGYHGKRVLVVGALLESAPPPRNC
jgi:hypothetical protein